MHVAKVVFVWHLDKFPFPDFLCGSCPAGERLFDSFFPFSFFLLLFSRLSDDVFIGRGFSSRARR